jgi:triosephosphate isomerase (TIM)
MIDYHFMKKLIIANWKLNPPTLTEAQKLAAKVVRSRKYTVVLCPPTLFLSGIEYPNVGAQDCFWKTKGPFTGQTSPEALKSLKVKYCIVGHSERRALGETNEQINTKARALLAVGITPIICIGFGTSIRQDELEVADILKDQLREGLETLPPDQVVVAYEPVWAISTGDPYATKKMPTPEHAETIALFIKTKYHVGKILYGGSVNSTNASSFLAQPYIDGLLVGGASLLPDDFNKIIS